MNQDNSDAECYDFQDYVALQQDPTPDRTIRPRQIWTEVGCSPFW